MSVIRGLNQTATYWANVDRTQTDKFGKPTVSAPVQLKCRWEDRIAVIVNKTGEEYTSKARVFFAQDVNLDGYLYLGTTAETDPTAIDDAFEIQGKSTVPDLRSVKALTTAYL